MASPSAAAPSVSFNYTNYSKNVNLSRPLPTPVIVDFLADPTLKKLSGLSESLRSSSWKSVNGQQLVELVTTVQLIEETGSEIEEVAQQVNYLTNLIFFNMTTIQALEAFSSMNSDQRIQFLEDLPLQSRLWVIQSEFSKMDDLMQDQVVLSIQQTMEELKTDVFFHEHIYPAEEETNAYTSCATILITLAKNNPKLDFINDRLLDLISSESSEQTLKFPLIALAEHVNQVDDTTYREAVLTRVKNHLLILDQANRLSNILEKVDVELRVFHAEVEGFAKHLNAVHCLGPRFRTYINDSIMIFKESIFDGSNDVLFSDLIPIFLQFVALDEEDGVNIKDFELSFWLEAPAELINPLLDIWLESLEPENHSEVMDSLFLLTYLDNLNPEIKSHLINKP